MVTSSFSCCFVLLFFLFLVRGEVLYHKYGWKTKQEGAMLPKGDGNAVKGCQRSILAVTAHSLSAILLRIAFLKVEADPVNCE